MEFASRSRADHDEKPLTIREDKLGGRSIFPLNGSLSMRFWHSLVAPLPPLRQANTC